MSQKIKSIIKRILNKETMSYIIFGVFTTIVDYATFAILNFLTDKPILSNNISWVAAVTFAYITNKLYVFDSKSFSFSVIKKEIPSFLGARVFSLIITDIFLAFADIFGMNALLAKLIISVLVVIINYFLSKIFVFKKKNETNSEIAPSKSKLESFVNEHTACFVAFIVPVIIMVAIYISREIFPWGDEMYLRSDMYHQYAPFYKELYRKLSEGGSLTYSWNIGMGVNFTSLYAYYLASPINLLIGLLPGNNIPEIMSVFIILKIGLSSFTAAYYCKHHFNTKNVSIAVVGIFYAMSSYFAAFSWNIMWLDCMVLLPLILLGLERLVKDGRCKLYCISLAIAIFSNYYIAIMLCIFSVLYFVVLLAANNTHNEKYFYIKRICNFSLYSLLAGGMAACLLLPELYGLSKTVSSEITFPESLVNYFSVLDMLSRSLMEVETAIFSAHDPNIYCTVAVFFLIPLYFFTKKINKREKVGKIILLGFFLFSFNTNIPNYIWHGLHYPNSLPCRESFIYIFLVLVMCYDVLKHILEYTKKQIYGCFFGGLGVILLIEELYVGSDYAYDIIFVSIIFLLLYLLLFSIYRQDSTKRGLIIYLMFVVVIAEVYINTDETGYSTTSRVAYYTDNEAIDTLLDQVEEYDENSFYRVEKTNRRTKNDAAWNDYHGVSIFSSLANGNLSKYLGFLGQEMSTNAYSYYGATPLMSSLLSVRYEIANIMEDDYEANKHLLFSSPEQSRYVYENHNTLPLGFMLPASVDDNWILEGNNPFVLQNNFVKYATNITNPMFTKLESVVTGQSVNFTMTTTQESEHVYAYVISSVETVSAVTRLADGTSYSAETFSGLKHKMIIDLGMIPAGSTTEISTSDDSVSSLQMYIYSYDNQVFLDTYEQLNDEPFEIESFEDTDIKGTITAKEDGLMYTSITYESGWKAYVDGKEVKTVAFEETLLAVPVTAGTHTVELKFVPTGLYPGILLSLLSILIFILINILRKKLKAYSNKPTDDNDIDTVTIDKTKAKADTNANTSVDKSTATIDIDNASDMYITSSDEEFLKEIDKLIVSDDNTSTAYQKK